MEKKIRVSVTHVSHQSMRTKEEKETFSEVVNGMLDSIKDEAIKWNAEVEVRESDQGNFDFIAISDNQDLRNRMQALISEGLAEE